MKTLIKKKQDNSAVGNTEKSLKGSGTILEIQKIKTKKMLKLETNLRKITPKQWISRSRK